MRISDWSSDVCSSDLRHQRTNSRARPGRSLWRNRADRGGIRQAGRAGRSNRNWLFHESLHRAERSSPPPERRSEERRVGKECAVRVDLGGRRIIKKKKKENKVL